MDQGAGSYRRYLEGDESAFEQIIKEYREMLTFFIYGFVKDYQIAEDIAIDVFAALAVKKHYNGRSSFKSFLFTIARSRALDELRRMKRRHSLPLTEAENYIYEDSSIVEEYLAEEEKTELHKALMILPEKQRTVLHLIYFEDLSYEESAKIMGMSKKQIDNLLYRAKNSLRSVLSEKSN